MGKQAVKFLGMIIMVLLFARIHFYLLYSRTGWIVLAMESVVGSTPTARVLLIVFVEMFLQGILWAGLALAMGVAGRPLLYGAFVGLMDSHFFWLRPENYILHFGRSPAWLGTAWLSFGYILLAVVFIVPLVVLALQKNR